MGAWEQRYTTELLNTNSILFDLLTVSEQAEKDVNDMYDILKVRLA